MFHTEKNKIVTAESALKGRDDYLFQLGAHHVFSEPMIDIEHSPNKLILGMGCFWGAE
jgi:peptide-methionine (S)-S-oxide reductase